MGMNVIATECCPACGSVGMKVLSSPRPQFVERCPSCGSAFYHSGDAEAVSHNDAYNIDANYQRYLETSNESSMRRRYEEALVQLTSRLPNVEQPHLFDIGAGGGDFLALARNRGFRIAGNEVSRPAIDECRTRHGIDLVLSDDLLALASEAPKYDAATMWCVIAHVDDPGELLSGARALLRPGGILFLSTPRYCIIDRVALFLRHASADRFRRLFDRRINHFHRRQYTRRGMEELLRRHHFEPESVRPTVGYGLHMAEYLRSLGLPEVVAKPIGAALDLAVRTSMLPRNILSVYARAV